MFLIATDISNPIDCSTTDLLDIFKAIFENSQYSLSCLLSSTYPHLAVGPRYQCSFWLFVLVCFSVLFLLLGLGKTRKMIICTTSGSVTSLCYKRPLKQLGFKMLTELHLSKLFIYYQMPQHHWLLRIKLFKYRYAKSNTEILQKFAELHFKVQAALD